MKTKIEKQLDKIEKEIDAITEELEQTQQWIKNILTKHGLT